MFQIGEKFGDYEVVKILGAGGMGQVYKVRNTLSDRFEAMKVLLPNLQQHADLADRFLREIKVQAALQHKNIAGLHTAQRQDDRILMFIEFVDGITLDRALQQGPLSPELAANIIGQVLEALAYAHARGVVHRDIKPENIMVQPDGVVKLMDFGIARLAQDKRLTSTGRTVGSLYYMSPEQIRGADDLDGRSDLYSLGVTLYQCVTGKRPFDGDSDYSIMAAHIQQNPVKPIELDPHVPAAMNDVIMMAISKDRAQRFQTADAFHTALIASVGGTAAATRPMAAAAAYAPPPPPVVVATPPPPPPHPQPVPVPTVVTAPPKPTQVMPPPPPPPAMQSSGGSSSKGLWIGVAVVAVAAIGGVGAWKGPEWLGSGNATKTETPATTTQQPQQQPQSQLGAGSDPGGNAPAGTTPATPSSGSTATAPPSTTAGTTPQLPPVSGRTQQPQQQQSPVAQRPPVQTQPVSTPPVPQQQTRPSSPVASTPQYQVEPAAQTPPPQRGPDPQVARELEELRQHFNALSTRFASAQESVRRLEAQQQRQGFGMRRDVREAITRFQYLMKESSDSLVSRNADGARTNLQMAERNLERIEKFLGN
jgi:serine/threonine-protein kinase